MKNIWKSDEDISEEARLLELEEQKAKEIEQLKIDMQNKLRGKPFKNLNTSDKDYLLEGMAKILGIID